MKAFRFVLLTSASLLLFGTSICAQDSPPKAAIHEVTDVDVLAVRAERQSLGERADVDGADVGDLLAVDLEDHGLADLVRVPGRLRHRGGLVFTPAGAEGVKIRFEGQALVVEDGPLVVRATRV